MQLFIIRFFNFNIFSREYLAYDLNDLVGSVGGYLGLFLGWSLLGVTVPFSFLVLNYLKKFS